MQSKICTSNNKLEAFGSANLYQGSWSHRIRTFVLIYPTVVKIPAKNSCICASGCKAECCICNQELSRSNLGQGYFTPRSTQPSIPLGSVNEYQLRLGRQRQVWLIPLAGETQGVQVKLCYPLTMCALPECLRDASCRGDIQIDYLYLYLYLYLYHDLDYHQI